MSDTLATRLAALTPEQRARLRAALPGARPDTGEPAPGQLRLWQVHQQVDGRPVDVVCQAVRFTGAPVDLDLLAARVRGFAAAHEALRTTFETSGDGTGTVRRVVHRELAPRLSRIRCADEAEAHAAAVSLAAEPFDPATGPLLRVALAEGPAPDLAWMLVAVHNLVFDAWSFELLLDELARKTDPAAAPRPYSAYVRDQADWLRGPEGRAGAAYWAAETAAAPAPLPTDRPRAEPARRDGARIAFTLPAPVADAVAASAQREATTAYAGWLAVAWAALAEFGGSEDVLLGTFTTGRNRPGTDTVVGYLLNVLPVRLRDGGTGSHRDRVRAVRTATRAGLEHASYPGELIDAGRRVPGTHPLFDAVFVFDNLGADERRVQGARVTTADLDKGTARFDLTLAVYPGPDGVTGWLEYDTALYDEATVRRLAERFTALAHLAAQEADQ
ncbi:condensation domain-containing protein [Streptomyces sp. NBC_00525]|uniref:condensation domain-containing protein n=1 Tax=Streptomyces sp. NBC_00525 TaxID=2903660 RepID=UPI002E80D18C|nr:condensation domain-containing protein [Streptomyces sp. NBC_00525]WUC95456.1 condensation domain-containing protein [Streptomyces sp. NBC_00525]